jgi:prophage DNA circulation protein
MAYDASNRRAIFDGVEFPITECSLEGSLKQHVHEFPYAPGGPVELMARKPYRIAITSLFFDSSPFYGPSLYPQALNEIRRRYEAQFIAPLDVPNLGTIRAYITEFKSKVSGRVLNGEEVSLVFAEDTTELFSVERLLQANGSALDRTFEIYKLELDQLENPPDLFESIRQFGNSLFAIIDTLRLFDAFIAAKIDGLTSLLERATDELDELKNAENFALIEAVKNFWAAAQEFGETLAGTARLLTYSVPAPSTLAEVCLQIYGDTSRAQDLLNLNVINNPFKIPAGEVLVYAPLEITAAEGESAPSAAAADVGGHVLDGDGGVAERFDESLGDVVGTDGLHVAGRRGRVVGVRIGVRDPVAHASVTHTAEHGVAVEA